MEIEKVVSLAAQDLDSLSQAAETAVRKNYNQRYTRIFKDKKITSYKSLKALEIALHKEGDNDNEKIIGGSAESVQDSSPKNLLKILSDIRKQLIDIELEYQQTQALTLQIPPQIPINEVRIDLEEAAKGYDSGCYASAIVMLRRAYEGALKEKYQEIEGKKPLERQTCQHCGKVTRDNVPFSISKLHRWAIEKGVVHNKFQQIGQLIPDMGAGAAHPQEVPMIRDKQVTKFNIDLTVTLLCQIYPEK